MHLILLALQFLCSTYLGRPWDVVVNVAASFVHDTVVWGILFVLLLAHGTLGVDQGDVLEEVAGSFLLCIGDFLAAHVNAGLLHNSRPTRREPVDVHGVA